MANRFQPIDLQPDSLPVPNQTDKTLGDLRAELSTTFSAVDWGGGCPFCTAELCALQAAKDEFGSVGATLAVVTLVHWFGRVEALLEPLKPG